MFFSLFLFYWLNFRLSLNPAQQLNIIDAFIKSWMLLSKHVQNFVLKEEWLYEIFHQFEKHNTGHSFHSTLEAHHPMIHICTFFFFFFYFCRKYKTFIQPSPFIFTKIEIYLSSMKLLVNTIHILSAFSQHNTNILENCIQINGHPS